MYAFVIFSFFRTDNDLVCAPPHPDVVSHTLVTPQLRTYLRIQKLLAQFS